MVTRPDLDAIRARCDAATPGPWRVDGSTYDEDCNEHLAPYGLEGPNERLIWSSGGGEYSHPDMDTAQFIASCRTDIPALLAYVERLRAERDEARAERDNLLDGDGPCHACREYAFRRGAEAMRLACQQWCRAWENDGNAIADALADLRVEDKP